MRRPLPWGDYASRALSCALLFVTGFALLSESTFALRMRNDIPFSLGGLDGPQSIALIVAGVISVIPLLAGPAFLGVFLACGWLISGLGAYWWTTIPWDELLNDGQFPGGIPAGLLDYALVAGPAMIATLHVVLSRVSRLRSDARARGIDPDESRRAAAAAFLAGAGTLVAAFALSAVFWWLMASGALTSLGGLPRGVPALVLGAAVVCAGWALATKRVRLGRVRVPKVAAAPEDKPAPASTKKTLV
ncbi:MAG: hypothetical protein QOE90_1233 [Thermoplasmata archaeon]|nr:hypothetical protein [Thermoplasmata archaeon]